MSKASKTKTKLKRLAAKRARKASKQAEYESYKRAGQNKKSKRFRKGQKAKVVRSKIHPIDCGNPGCIRCYPEINNPWSHLVKRSNCLYSKRFTSSKWCDVFDL